MRYYNKDLYHHIIEEFADSATELRIITGYGSYTVTEHLLRSYPHLRISLYIGMTSTDGISQETHDNFLRLVKQYTNRLDVYYQITHPSTHIKLYTWLKNGNVVTNILGSANFTENGLFKLNELMVESDLDYSNVFAKQISFSIACTSEKVYDNINIYEEEVELLDSNDKTPSIINDEAQSYSRSSNTNEEFSVNYSIGNRNPFYIYRHQLRGIVSSPKRIEIPVILKNVGNYDTRGINNRFRSNQLGYLMKTNRYPFKNFFPLDIPLTFYTDDGRELKGMVYESRIDNLYFDDDIYGYFFNRLNLSELRPISQLDLDEYGRESITIFKLNETEYLFDFSKNT